MQNVLSKVDPAGIRDVVNGFNNGTQDVMGPRASMVVDLVKLALNPAQAKDKFYREFDVDWADESRIVSGGKQGQIAVMSLRVANWQDEGLNPVTRRVVAQQLPAPHQHQPTPDGGWTSVALTFDDAGKPSTIMVKVFTPDKE